MTDIQEHIASRKLREIALPGTHDSGSYDLVHSSGTSIGSGLANCQSRTIARQLRDGIRYFDLRVRSGRSSTLYLVHTPNGYWPFTFWGQTVFDVIADIDRFLDETPGELVVLSFNHFYAMNTSLHERLAEELGRVFGGKLVPRDKRDQTMGACLDAAHKVVVLYGGDQPGSAGCDAALYRRYPFLWQLSANLVETWANTTSFATLRDRARRGLASRDPGKLHCLFGTFTMKLPWGVYPSIEHMADRVNPPFQRWLRDRLATAQPRPNAVCIDYYEKTSLVQTAIEMNQGLGASSPAPTRRVPGRDRVSSCPLPATSPPEDE